MFVADLEKIKATKEIGGSGKAPIQTSGMYLVTIERAEQTINNFGARHIRLRLNCDGYGTTYIFGPKLDTNSKGEHFERVLFSKLLVCCGVTQADTQKVEVEFNQGKKETVDVYPALSNKQVYIRLALEVSRYNGTPKTNLIIKNFFRADDKASALEIVNKEPAGTQFAKEETIADKIIYKDNTSKEDVERIAEQRFNEYVTKIAKENPNQVAPEINVKNSIGNDEIPF